MPDVPLALLTLGSAAYYWYLSTITPDFNMGGAMMKVFNDLYFQNPWWISLTHQSQVKKKRSLSRVKA